MDLGTRKPPKKVAIKHRLFFYQADVKLRKINNSYLLTLFKHLLILSAVRKVAETLKFQPLGSFETLGSKLSHGTLQKFADVRIHLRKGTEEVPFLPDSSSYKPFAISPNFSIRS